MDSNMSIGKINIFIFNLGVDKTPWRCYNKGTKNGTRKEITTMIKKTFENTLSYQFDATRKNAKYTIDGEKWMNHGEFARFSQSTASVTKPRKMPTLALTMVRTFLN